MSVNFEVHQNACFSYIKVNKERLDSTISPELKAQLVMLSSQGERNIILDLESCRYCDSSVLTGILVGNRLCDESNGMFVICNLSPGVDKLIRIAMLDSILLIATDYRESRELLTKKFQIL